MLTFVLTPKVNQSLFTLSFNICIPVVWAISGMGSESSNCQLSTFSLSSSNLDSWFSDSIQTTEQSTWSGGNLKLRCPLTSNLATVSWERDNHPLKLSDRLQQLDDGLLILNASGTDSGQYKCLSVERSKTGQFSTSVARFNVKITARTDSGMMAAIQGLGVVVALLACLIGLLFWTIYKQQQFPSGTSKKKDSKGRGQVSELH